MKKRILTIGSVTKDYIITPDNSYTQIGGAVYYQYCTLHQLKTSAESIISIGKNDLELLNAFPDKKHIHTIQFENTIEYTNIYNRQLQRKQKAKLYKQTVTPEKIKLNLSEYEKAIISPLCPTDITPETLAYIKGNVAETTLLPQGMLRKTDPQGNIIKRKWTDVEKYLKNTDILSLDEHEAQNTFGITKINNKTIQKIIRKYDMKSIIITRAEKGSTIYTKEKFTNIPAIKTEKQVDATGLGDTYIAAYHSKKLENTTDYEAGLFASLVCTKKLEETGPVKSTKEKIEEEYEIILDKYRQ